MRVFEHGAEFGNAVEGAAHAGFLGLVGHENDGHALAGRAAALEHRGEADVLVAECRRHVGDHAGPVGHVQTDVVGALARGDGQARGGGEFGGRQLESHRPAPMRDIDEIGDHGRSRGPRPRAAPFADQAADEIAFGDDGIVDVLDMRDRRFERDKARMHALHQPGLGQLGDAQQLDAVAELARELDVLRPDAADALDVHGREIDARAESHAGEDRELVRGVDAVDVEAGIGLGVAELLRVGQHVGERLARFAHPGEDVVAGPVEDAVDAAQPVARQPLADRLDDRNAARDGGFVGDGQALRFGREGELRAKMREQRLVGGDDVPPRVEGGFHRRARDAVRPADQLDHDVALRLARHLGGVVVPSDARQIEPPVFLARPCGHGDHTQRPPAAPGDQRAIGVDQLEDAGTDRAEAGDGNVEGPAHALFFAGFCVGGSGRRSGAARNDLICRTA